MVLGGKITRSAIRMRLVSFFLCLGLALGFAQCKRSSTTPSNPWLGHYELTGYDVTDKIIYTGTMSLLSLEGTHLKGNCTIKPEKDAPEGLLDQNSRCEGIVSGRTVEVDLAPFLDDAGLLLEGQLDNDRIAGVWRLDGFATSQPLGRFEALKRTGANGLLTNTHFR